MKHKNINIVYGPPGTGKTYNLMSKLDGLLKLEIPTKEIGFVTFTRKASAEARSRALKQFKLQDIDLPFFKTLHSMAFHMLGLNKEDIMGYVDYIDICKMLGLTISAQVFHEDGNFSIVHTKGDRLFFLENLARATKKSYKEVLDDHPNDDIVLEELTLLSKTITQYKRVRHKLDFTDMIVKFNESGLYPDIQALFVDETQDLSPIQWDMVWLLARNAQEVYLAGDDDQAIFKWAGADVKTFLELEGKSEVLCRSFRVPGAVHALAATVLTRIKTRKFKPYFPTDCPGSVKYVDSVEQIDMGAGTWMLLARNIFFLSEYANYCVAKGYLFETKYNPIISEGAAQAIQYWERIRRGEMVSGSMAKLVYQFLGVKTSVKYGYKSRLTMIDDLAMVDIEILMRDYGLVTQLVWHKALGNLKPSEITYFMNALKRGEDMMIDPRIRVSTIHGVKGGETDNVVLVTDMSKRTFEEFETNPDDELRVWYVGITRAKKNVFILNPQTPYYIEL